jgi:hypothetical protein
MNKDVKLPETGSVWTWKKGQPKFEAEIVVVSVEYFGFGWLVRAGKADGTRFEDGLKQFEVSLERFLENASKDDIESEFLKLAEELLMLQYEVDLVYYTEQTRHKLGTALISKPRGAETLIILVDVTQEDACSPMSAEDIMSVLYARPSELVLQKKELRHGRFMESHRQ